MLKPRSTLVLALAIMILVTPASSANAQADKSDNVALIARFPYKTEDTPFNAGGTDIAFSGDFAYAAEQGWEGSTGGVHIYDLSGPIPKHVSFVRCGGWQNDVAVVKPGLIALGYHQGRFNCGTELGGVTLIDVKNPRRPKILGSTTEALAPDPDPASGYYLGAHTITAYPGKPIIYASPGGRQMQSKAIETIIDVSDPGKPRVVARFDSGIGCHDFTFDIREERQIGLCAGPGETQVWDVSDPLAPTIIGHIVNPLHNFHHSVAVSSDGRYAVIGTETAGNDCAGGPSGALFIYDISDPAAAVPLGYFGAPRGPHPVFAYGQPGPAGDCAAHLFNLIPGTQIVVSGNYWGGMSVVDFSDPLRPKELAHYSEPGLEYWTAYWHDGRIYANGFNGFDAFEVEGIAATSS
ncbi:MAG TPA: hypothetical protein VNC78_01870 [Actinomycetota bacterium]|nr:hypothetical protein [Actinomycetota bacterium]